MKYQNAKEYWGLQKQAANNIKHSLNSKQFSEYFKAIDDPGTIFFRLMTIFFILTKGT